MNHSPATFTTTQPSSPTYYNSSSTILLLLDWHSLFLFRIPGPSISSAVTQATKLRSWAQSHSIPVIHCLIDPTLPFAPNSKDQDRTKPILDALKADPAGWAEPSGIKCDNHDSEGQDIERMFLRAPGYVSAQKSEGLNEYLSQGGFKSLILSGVSTSGCVLRTAVVGTEEDYVVTVVEDACADPGEGVHEMMVKQVLPMRAHVVTLEGLREEWEAVNGKK